MELNITNTENIEAGYAVSISDSFIDSFSTPRGSVIGNYNYGTEAYKLKHRSCNSSWIIDFIRCCKDACKHDKRLTFKEAIVDTAQISVGIILFTINLGYLILKGSVNV